MTAQNEYPVVRALTSRPISPGAETWIGKPIACLDHGYVELVDYMGTDRDIVLAARTTTATEDKSTADDDRNLLRYLVRHRHTTPVEMVRARFRLQMPVFVARQLIRHRMSSTNEHSLRYSAPIDAMYLPQLEHVALQSTSNRQGRGAVLAADAAQRVVDLMNAHDAECMRLYHELADDFGVARELARSVLPMNLYTRWVWTIDLHNLMHLLGLRLDPHAQLEIRVFAQALAQIVSAWVPLAYEAFVDYRLEARTGHRTRRAGVAAMLRLPALVAHRLAPDRGRAAAASAGVRRRQRRMVEHARLSARDQVRQSAR